MVFGLEIIIIAAIAENGVIGKDGKMPWNIKEDLKHFKKLTTGHTCIMGRKTYESLHIKPLPNRTNIVLTKNKEWNPKKVIIKHTLKEAIKYCKEKEEINKVYICGGESVYKKAIEKADKLEITKINEDYEGDSYFPNINYDNWKLVGEDKRNGLTFQTYEKINSSSK